MDEPVGVPVSGTPAAARGSDGSHSAPARMVEVGGKDVTLRVAVAECTISMTPEACAALVAGTPKGDPLEAAKVAGLMAAKRTPDLLPFCHPVALTGAAVVVQPDPTAGTIRVEATVKANDRDGWRWSRSPPPRCRAQSVRHREGVRPRGGDQRPPARVEVGWQERGLHRA